MGGVEGREGQGVKETEEGEFAGSRVCVLGRSLRVSYSWSCSTKSDQNYDYYYLLHGDKLMNVSSK